MDQNATTTTSKFVVGEQEPLGLSEALCIAVSLAAWVLFVWLIRTSKNQARICVLGGDGDFKWSSLRKEHVTHPARGSTRILAAIRLFFAACVIGVIVYTNSLRVFMSFTGWSWAMLGLYMLLAGIATLTSSEESKEDQATGFHCFLWVGFQVVTVVAIFVTLIVYFVLMPSTWACCGWDAMIAGAYYNIPGFIMHHFNVVFVIVEGLLNRMRFCRTHVLFAMIYGNMYIVFSWWIYFNFGFFFYFFLDWSNPLTPMFYLVLIATLYGFFFAILRCLGPCMERGVDDVLLPSCGTRDLSSTQEAELI